MRFPDKTLADLEWQRLLDHLADRCTGEEAASLCRNLPFLEPDEIPRRLELIDELITCIGEGDPPPILPFYPMGDWLARIRGEGSAPPEALLGIASNLKLFAGIHRYLDNRKDVCPKNAEIVSPQNGGVSAIGLARLAAEIEGSFEPDGAIADGASKDLGRLRRRVLSLRKQLVERVEQIAAAESDLLQERNISFRNDRFVLPVRADAHRRFPGIVHGASSSGATVFVEPESVIETGNELMLAREAVHWEEKRILKQLSDAIRDDLDDVETACKLGIETEVRIAAAKLTLDLDGTLPNPAASGHFNLMGARHPLLVLDGVSVIPCNVSCEPGTALIISGPNAGGKTVVLKTVGLLCLMLRAGLPVPVLADSQMGVPMSVLTDIGDEQSLIKNLSTFSAHMKNISSITESAKLGVVVLLDELAAGTDPNEGAALAEAFLEKLSDLQATTLATTHFESLKARAEDLKSFTNAAVGFDSKTMVPTFELRVGTPGSSSALAVARRFGVSNDVIERAQEILPEGLRGLSKAVEALEKERVKASLERQTFTKSRSEAEEMKRRLSAEIRDLRSRQEKLIDKEMNDLWAAIKRGRERVRDAEVSIKRRRKDQSVVAKARKKINEVAEELDPRKNPLGKKGEELPGKPASEEDVVGGALVYVKSFGAKGKVETDLKGGQTFVRIGNVRTKVALEDLRVLKEPTKAKVSSKRIAKQGQTAKAQALKTSENTIDLRGATVDEALNSTERFLDTALKNGWLTVFIVHGHGTGALRDSIREFLSESVYVEDYRPGERDEGGDGITVAWIR